MTSIKRKGPNSSATLYKIGTKKKGNDGNIWIIVENKNNIKRWQLYKKSQTINKKDTIKKEIKFISTPDEYYKQFSNYTKPINDTNFFYNEISSLTSELKNIGILFFFLKWNIESTYSSHIEYILEQIDKYNKTNPGKYPNGYIFTSDKLLYVDSCDDKIYIHHGLNKKIIDEFNKIFISHFPNKTLGFQNYNDAIIVYFNEHKKINKIKNHSLWLVNYEYKKKDEKIEDDIYIGEFISKIIGEKIIFDLYDVYNYKGKITLFYEIYDDKIYEFAKLIKTLKIPKMPNISKIIIEEADKKIINKSWVYKF